MSIPVRLTALLLALLSVAPTVQVQAHGFLKTPRSRSYVANQQGMEYDHFSLNRKASQETCGQSPARNYNNWSSGIVNTYSCGQQIDVEVELRAHHNGHFEVKACPISPGQTASQACFDSNRLRFVSGPRGGDANYPYRAYFPPFTGPVYPGPPLNYWYKFQLPQGLSGDLVLLQWHYVTSNSCFPPGYTTGTYNTPFNLNSCPNPLPSEILLPITDPGPAPEQFWNCAEVRITNNCSGGPVPTPTPPPVPPTGGQCAGLTGQCGPSRTCASIGFPGQCCSQYGWCGTSAAHCGACCQNGCTGVTSGGSTITVQAESYSNSFGVVPESTSDAGGGLNVGNLNTGDWMSYPAVSIPTSGTYRVSYRVAGFGGSLQLERAGGSPVFGSVTIPWTGGWQNWQTVSHTVNLSAGSLPLGIKVTGGGWNLNWFTITKV